MGLTPKKADQFGKYKVMLGNVGYDVTVPDYYSTSEFEDTYTYDAANLIAGEKVQIVDNNNGERLETYIIKGERGSKTMKVIIK